MLAEENIGKIAHVFGSENFNELNKCFITYYLRLDGKTLANRWTVAKFANVFSCHYFILYSILLSCLLQKMQIFLLRAGSGNYMHVCTLQLEN